jgi:serine phosphatase RsbU (regulator of sigma subunit)
VLVVRRGDDTLEVVDTLGPDIAPRWSAFALDAGFMVTEAARRATSLFAETRKACQVIAPATAEVADHLGDASWVALPLIASGATVGAVSFGFSSEREFTDSDRNLLETVSSLCSPALERTIRYERERRDVITLQRSMLPATLPTVPGTDRCAIYDAAGTGTEVGGDWYEFFPAEPNLAVLTVGDCASHGIPAAVMMGRLRNLIRGIAAVDPDPASVLTHAARVATTLTDAFATLAYATLDLDTSRLRLGLAGHPPPILIAPDGTASLLQCAPNPPLGVASRRAVTIWETTIATGSTVLLFTDGLVEDRRTPLDEALERLTSIAADEIDHNVPLEPACRATIKRMLNGRLPQDDICVLAVRRT